MDTGLSAWGVSSAEGTNAGWSSPGIAVAELPEGKRPWLQERGDLPGSLATGGRTNCGVVTQPQDLSLHSISSQRAGEPGARVLGSQPPHTEKGGKWTWREQLSWAPAPGVDALVPWPQPTSPATRLPQPLWLQLNRAANLQCHNLPCLRCCSLGLESPSSAFCPF